MIANGGRAQIVDFDDDAAFGKTLTLVVPDAPAEWLQPLWWKERRLTISNPDAKKAVAEVRVVGVPAGGEGGGGVGAAADGGVLPQPALAPPVNSETAGALPSQRADGGTGATAAAASTPAITGLERRRRDAGDAKDALILKGTGFAMSASFEVNGEKRAAEVVGPGELLLALTSADLARIEAGGDTSIVVVNPDGSRSAKRNYPS
jgi:hypothetical protein